MPLKLGGNDYLKICISCNIHTKILIYSHYRSQHNTKSMKPSAKYSQTIQILHSVNAIWMRCERWHLLFSSCKWFATHSHSTSKMRMHLEYSWESFPPRWNVTFFFFSSTVKIQLNFSFFNSTVTTITIAISKKKEKEITNENGKESYLFVRCSDSDSESNLNFIFQIEWRSKNEPCTLVLFLRFSWKFSKKNRTLDNWYW